MSAKRGHPNILVAIKEEDLEAVFFFLAKFVAAYLEVVSFAMVVKMLMPIFIDVDGNRIYGLANVITEPFVAPVRTILAKLDIGQNSPIDWGFFAAYFIIWFIQIILPEI